MDAPLSPSLQLSTPLVYSILVLDETAARYRPQGGEDIEVHHHLMDYEPVLGSVDCPRSIFRCVP
jgi:hypothetical protein